jgi:hypothetical protein
VKISSPTSPTKGEVERDLAIDSFALSQLLSTLISLNVSIDLHSYLSECLLHHKILKGLGMFCITKRLSA